MVIVSSMSSAMMETPSVVMVALRIVSSSRTSVAKEVRLPLKMSALLYLLFVVMAIS